MALLTVRRMRIWVLFLTFVNVALVSSVYIYLETLMVKYSSQTRNLAWIHWIEIVSSVALFFAYIYSLWGKHFIPNRIVRAVLITVLALALLVVESAFLVDTINDAKALADMPPEVGDFVVSTGPFICFEDGLAGCHLDKASMFAGLITGLFVLVEVVLTLVMKGRSCSEIKAHHQDDVTESL